MSSIRVRVTTTLTLLFALATTACSGGSGSPADLPQGGQVLQQASAAMRDVRSIAFSISTEGKPAVPVRSGDIKLLKSGDAEGTLQLEQAGQAIEMNFVLLGDTVHYKGLTGGYQKLPRAMVAQLYDPTAVLDPDRGIAKLLTGATGPTTEAREKIGDRDTYRIKATLPRDTAAALVPGITQDLTGQVWVDTADHRPRRVRMRLPAAGGGTGTVTVSFTEFDVAYKIVAPK
ncbi:MAG: LppX_LprAFG lipoprotein [Actinomadura sp.]